MKRISLLLTVLCAAGLPLTAAALDYGPSQRMLAAEGSTAPLPTTHADENPFAELATPHHQHGDDEDSAQASGNSGNSGNDAKPGPQSTARRSSAPMPGPAGAGAGPAPKHGVLSWQSLLPGSIQ